jgi:uncharacterized protein (TIGR02594 family)
MPSWYDVAKAELGVHEIASGENLRILEYHSTTTLHAKQDEMAWCSAFVNWCFKQVEIEGTSSAAVDSWKNWGVSIAKPIQGCVVVLPHHVTFYDHNKGDGWIDCLGGNQGDSVKHSGFQEEEVISYRWPEGVPI